MMKHAVIVLLGCLLLAGPASAAGPGEDFDPTARQKPMQVIAKLDRSIDDDTWVAIVWKVDNAHAPALVPLLRPLMPKTGHLVAHAESNTLLLTDRYGNIRKLIEIVEIIDAATPRQQRD